MNSEDGGLKHAALTEKIIGAFYEVYNELGHGFLESVYQNALVVVLRAAGLSVQCQVPIDVCFRGETVGEFRADVVAEGLVLAELKAARAIDNSFEAQTL